MRKRLARTQDRLDERNLPRGEKARTQLNHRTKVTSPAQDRRKTCLIVARMTALSLLFAIPARFLASLSLPYVGLALFGLIVWNLAAALIRYLKGEATEDRLLWAGAFAAGLLLFWGLSFSPTTKQTYLLVFGPAVLATAYLSHVIAKQFAYWMSVNVRLELSAVRKWQGFWDYILKPVTPEECPEIESYRVGFLSILGAYVVGFVSLLMVERSRYADLAGLAGFLGFATALLLLWALWSTSRMVRWIPPAIVFRVAWQGVTNWFCYNAHETRAPGVFQFPTARFQKVWNRYRETGFTVFLLTLSIAQMEADPFARFAHERTTQLMNVSPIGPTFNARRTEASLTPNERAWLERLSEKDREPYLRRVFERRNGGTRAANQSAGLVIAKAVCFFAVLTLAPSILFFLVFATAAGRLLVAYHDALEARNAHEVKPGYWPWDNRVERILKSPNPLEREHVYIGRSVHGDYPIYLHLNLLHQHAHMMGDTGSRKTSVGIAPLMTQLIARADSSVLILDLKGDDGLFQCAKDEAELANLPFRYFTNVPGRSSHVFNPLRQSNSHLLTSNQRAQSILQALGLEYGEGYGEGYYSAMNEIVLKTYLAKYPDKLNTFKDLNQYVSTPHAYRGAGGVESDWKNARHLAILLDKLASVSPLNLTAEDLRAKPEAFNEQIDMPNILKEKQVCYFFLSSPLEPTTVSPIARLAMFNLLAAAAQAQGRENRVYVIVDEFQRIITENVRLFLEQARSMKLHFILANQTLGQLKSRTLDLTDTVESCTAYKQSFKASDLNSLLHLEQAGGEALNHELQWHVQIPQGFDPKAAVSFGDGSERMAQVRETTGPRLEKNTIIELSAASWLSLVRFTEGSGFTQFSGYYTPIIHEYHIHEEFYKDRLKRDWPDVDEKTVRVEVTESKPVQGVEDEERVFLMPGVRRSPIETLDDEDDEP